MKFSEMKDAIADAKNTMRHAEIVTEEMAGLIVGRLRSGKVSGNILKALKAELQDFNATTYLWKDK